MQSKYSKEVLEQTLKDFSTFLRFQSISTDPAFKKPLHDCAEWVEAKLRRTGLQLERWECPKNEHPPILFAQSSSQGAEDSRPTWIIYQHYDVQPATVADGWDSDPFEPRVEGLRVFARGAQDNKGQCLSSLLALEKMKQTYGDSANWPVRVKVLIEGQEESGSSFLVSILEEKKDKLKADGWVLADIDIPSMDKPSVTLGMRGMLALDIELQDGISDKHSGLHGNLAYNSNRAMAELLASFYEEDGKVAIPGFYDGVLYPSSEELEMMDLSFDENLYEKDFGARPCGGWQKHSPKERLWFDPSLEINGVQGGYSGEGFKTVIPCKTIAKVSCRVAAGQDPAILSQKITSFVQKQVHSSLKVKVSEHCGSARAVQSSASSGLAQSFLQAISKERQIPAQFVFSGASIPVAQKLQALDGAPVIGIGYGLPTDRIHGPNEHFDLDRLLHFSEAVFTALSEPKAGLST